MCVDKEQWPLSQITLNAIKNQFNLGEEYKVKIINTITYLPNTIKRLLWREIISLTHYTSKSSYKKITNELQENINPSSQEQTIFSTLVFPNLSNSLYMYHTSPRCLEVFSNPPLDTFENFPKFQEIYPFHSKITTRISKSFSLSWAVKVLKVVIPSIQ